MRNKLLLLLLLMFMTSGMMYAQQQKTQQSQQRTAAPSYTLKGVLLDSLTQEGEPYATIKIAKKNAPQKALKMAVTDLNGKFQEKLTVAPGEVLYEAFPLRYWSSSQDRLRCYIQFCLHPPLPVASEQRLLYLSVR